MNLSEGSEKAFEGFKQKGEVSDYSIKNVFLVSMQGNKENS